MEDESGSTEYRYGKLGEQQAVEKHITRLTPNSDAKHAQMEYEYDYQGRMRSITYPDSEHVRYHYNRGGEVERISSEHNGLDTTYVEEVGYDEWGQRVYIRYGNGVETRYHYDENRRWLASIETENNLQSLQAIDYDFDAVGNILGIENSATYYTTRQEYEYDGLNQLTGAEGFFEDREHGYVSGTSRYTQEFIYDQAGNILNKTSSSRSNLGSAAGGLNYSLAYSYYENKPKQPERIGELWYLYDGNGNVMEERKGGHSEEAISGSGSISREGATTLLDRGIGLTRNETEEEDVYTRRYLWDEENRLKATIDSAGGTVDYRYDAEGMRTSKYSREGETLYFNRMWLMSTDGYEFRRSKNIYLGEVRIATRANKENDPSTGYEELNTYYYHADHLGSSNIVTDPTGEPYEHLEYTPFGETWIEKTSDAAQMLPYRFTGKELDRETGLYYYGARYLNPKSSRWVSGDPAGWELINPNREGFSFIESQNWYSYTSNNPVKYVDPTGLLEVESADLHNNTSASDRIDGTYEDNTYDSETHSLRANLDPVTSSASDPFAEGIDNYNQFMEDHGSLTARAGAGGAGHLSTSDIKNSIGAGIFIGAAASATVDFSFKISDKGATDKLDKMVGGSFGAGIAMGGELVFTENGTYISVSVGVGVGTPEGHFIVSDEIPTRGED